MSDIEIIIQEFIDNMDKLSRSLSSPDMTAGFLRGRTQKAIQEISVIGTILKSQEERLKKLEDTVYNHE